MNALHGDPRLPLTAGVVGAVFAPVLAAVGALAALLTECTIAVQREQVGEPEAPTPEAPADTPAEAPAANGTEDQEARA